MNIIKKIFHITLVLGIVISSQSCGDYLEPEDDNRLTIDDVTVNPIIAEGWLLKAYRGLPTSYNFAIDQASDDAETNNPNASVKVMNGGGWAADFDPVGVWNNVYDLNVYLNTFIENVDQIEWSYTDSTRNVLYKTRLKGEAYGLRAWNNFRLLQAHAGLDASGNLLGFPIVDKVLTNEDNLQLPRNTFTECYDYIMSDIEMAIANLPVRYEDGADLIENGVQGARYLNRFNGLAALLLKSRLALYAASPAYASSGAATYQEAALYAAEVITANGGLNLNAGEIQYYLDKDANANELIWYSSRNADQSNWEQDNFPPSLFGLGRTNPTQDFVDAFPLSDGTPFDISGITDPAAIYTNRDPRLAAYVVYNGAQVKSDGTIINTNENDPSGNGLGAFSGFATTSGYYLKKFLDFEDVELSPSGVTSGAEHFYTYARMTEAYLNFAEAANMAGGPDNSIGGFTPRQVINAIRTRAGISSTAYVDAIASIDDMTDLIVNERRIELSFEGHRFWDMRRWKIAINNSVKGIRINGTNDSFTEFTLASRAYQSHQVYGPIPFGETLKYDIAQNAGW